MFCVLLSTNISSSSSCYKKCNQKNYLARSLSLSLQHHAHSRKGNVFVCVVWKVGRSRVLGDLMEFLFDSELVVVFHFHN